MFSTLNLKGYIFWWNQVSKQYEWKHFGISQVLLRHPPTCRRVPYFEGLWCIYSKSLVTLAWATYSFQEITHLLPHNSNAAGRHNLTDQGTGIDLVFWEVREPWTNDVTLECPKARWEKIHAFINMFSTNMPMHWNSQRVLGANGWLRRKFWRTFGANWWLNGQENGQTSQKGGKNYVGKEGPQNANFYRSENCPTSLKRSTKYFDSQKSLANQHGRASAVVDGNFPHWFWRSCGCAEISAQWICWCVRLNGLIFPVRPEGAYLGEILGLVL